MIENEKPVQKEYTILSAVVKAQQYIKNISSGSLDGFLALTDSIVYAIKVANPEVSTDSEKLKAVSLSACMNELKELINDMTWCTCIIICLHELYRLKSCYFAYLKESCSMKLNLKGLWVLLHAADCHVIIIPGN